GVSLLHGFWYYEAERSFRWCIKLDPECAMAYWGLAQSVEGPEGRADLLLAEAVKRKHTVSERERLWIEAWIDAQAPWLDGRFERLSKPPSPTGPDSRDNKLLERLEHIVLRYPDDLEAKAFYILSSLWTGSRVANEALIQQVLAQAPEHPGAHHYRIHNWDDSEEGGVALQSCKVYGVIASEVGHARHMPGHVYSGLGMWREAGIWMESATRLELRQMRDKGLFPFDYWNYAHNRNYLAYIQEQQGLVEQALIGARTLLASPTNPPRRLKDKNEKADVPPVDFVQDQGMSALLRALLKFERWDEILREGAIPWPEGEAYVIQRAYAEALAHLGKADLAKALERAKKLDDLSRNGKDEAEKSLARRRFREVDALLRVRMGRTLEGLTELELLAREQALKFREEDDPPDDRGVLYGFLGELHLELGNPGLARTCFEKHLKLVRNDGFALSGLARAHAALRQTAEGARAWGRLRYVWARADVGLRWFESARALGLESEPIDESPEAQRDYDSAALATEGPITWEPFAAPELDALDASNQRVRLGDFRGRNIVLVFYLGGSCVHCVEELAALAKKSKEFAALDTTLIAVSADAPGDLSKPLAFSGLDLRLLSDSDHANARRFRAWDDFEDMALHATVLIDREGRLRWARVGGDPWDDAEFLVREIKSWSRPAAVLRASSSSGAASEQPENKSR
ncbi:MAG TPA: redoxin domain-containing protein, partial [Planctomycetota bacterium]|nr:redoxin domain-containing protein [Planctomycetota bacterium]